MYIFVILGAIIYLSIGFIIALSTYDEYEGEGWVSFVTFTWLPMAICCLGFLWIWAFFSWPGWLIKRMRK